MEELDNQPIAVLRLIETAKGRELATLKKPLPLLKETNFFRVTFSPDGKVLALTRVLEGTGARVGAVTLWETATCRELTTLKHPTDTDCGACFTPRGDTLITTGDV